MKRIRRALALILTVSALLSLLSCGGVLPEDTEPDVTDAVSKCTSFAQMLIIRAVDGVFPIYRYTGALQNGRVSLA